MWLLPNTTTTFLSSPAYRNWNISSWWARSLARACLVAAGWPWWCRAGPRRPPGDREPVTHPPPHHILAQIANIHDLATTTLFSIWPWYKSKTEYVDQTYDSSIISRWSVARSCNRIWTWYWYLYTNSLETAMPIYPHAVTMTFSCTI